MTLTREAKIGMHFRVDRLRGPRAIASAVLARHARDVREYGPHDMATMERIARRHRLLDFWQALIGMARKAL